MNLLTVSVISKKKGNQYIVKEINFDLPEYGKMAIAGETGSGKTTLLKMIAGLIQPDEGWVLLENKRVFGPEEKLIPGHQAIAYLSQQFELRNAYRVEEVLAYANQLTDAEALHLYQVCRIDHLLKRRTDQLSGGEKQRIAIARLLISSPRLLLLDEPYSNLDIIHKNILKSVIRDIGERLRLTCIMVSHSPLDTLSWADEIIIMKDGQIIQQGSPSQIYRYPVNEYAAALFGGYNLLDASTAGLFFKAKENNREKLLIRPEDFKIVLLEQGIKGEVMNVLFFGSYYELTVFIVGQSVTIKTQLSNIVKGDKISVLLAVSYEWYI
ncbi:MAG: ABC transporter ATP-binding protein [Chitinophagaceae bacterium]